MPSVVVDLERGVVRAGGRGAPVCPAPGRALRVGDDGAVAVLRPLSFGERSHAVRLATSAADPVGAVAASVRSFATVSAEGAYDVMHDVVALVLAGGDADASLPSYADVALLVARAAGWEPGALRDADATEVDALAARLGEAPADDGWMRLEMAPPTPESVVERLAETLLRRGLPGAGEAGAASAASAASAAGTRAADGGPGTAQGDGDGDGDARRVRRAPGDDAADADAAVRAGGRPRWRAAWGDAVRGAGAHAGAIASAGSAEPVNGSHGYEGREGGTVAYGDGVAAGVRGAGVAGSLPAAGSETAADGDGPGPDGRGAGMRVAEAFERWGAGSPVTTLAPVPVAAPGSLAPPLAGAAAPDARSLALPATAPVAPGLAVPGAGWPRGSARGSDGAAVPHPAGTAAPVGPAAPVAPAVAPAAPDLLAAAAVDDAALATRLARLLDDECDLRGYRP